MASKIRGLGSTREAEAEGGRVNGVEKFSQFASEFNKPRFMRLV